MVHTNPLSEYKIQASILLKQLRSDQSLIAESAATRVRRLSYFNSISLTTLQQQVQRKHTLTIIALENHYSSWEHLKLALEPINFYPKQCTGFINHWFSSYLEAKQYQGGFGGYLFPYKQQFFVCEAAYIAALGLNPRDSDWQTIGFDWVKPEQSEAWLRLARQLVQLSSKR